MGPAGSTRKRGNRDDDTWTTDLIEDEELWAVDEPAPAVIETRSEDRTRKDPGPALGR